MFWRPKPMPCSRTANAIDTVYGAGPRKAARSTRKLPQSCETLSSMERGPAAGRHFPVFSVIGSGTSLLGGGTSLLGAAETLHFRHFRAYRAKLPCDQGITGKLGLRSAGRDR